MPTIKGPLKISGNRKYLSVLVGDDPIPHVIRGKRLHATLIGRLAYSIKQRETTSGLGGTA